MASNPAKKDEYTDLDKEIDIETFKDSIQVNRPATLALKIVTKIIDFPRDRSFAIGSEDWH